MLNSTNLPLHPLKFIKKSLERIGSFLRIILIVICIFLIVIILLSDRYGKITLTTDWTLVFIAPFFLILLGIIIYEYLYYKLYYYNFDNEKGLIRKGVISKATGLVYYHKIQNVYVDQDFLDALLNLYDVHYETAGEKSGFYSHVDGLNKENAHKLVEFLNGKTKGMQGKKMEEGQGLKAYSKVDISQQEISRRTFPISIKYFFVIAVNIFLIIAAVFMFIYLDFILTKKPADLLILTYLMCGGAIPALVGAYVWYRNYDFYFNSRQGKIIRRLIAESVSYVNYDRIQNINILKGTIDSIFNIYTLKIETAGEQSSERLIIPGQSKENAEKIKDFLLSKTKSNKVGL